jgi:fumarate reductase subunit D
MRSAMIPASHKQPGYLAALLHRLAGIALAVFLPIHFLVLATALNGADALDVFLNITQTPLLKVLEVGIVMALALHMALGLRVLAIEFFSLRERTGVTVSLGIAAAIAVGIAYVLNVG